MTANQLVLTSPRLRYQVLASEHLDEFHRLVIDPHIKHYLMDGEDMDLDWCREAIATSDGLFQHRKVGLWLIFEPDSEVPVGFCGFYVFEQLSPEPQLLYALREAVTGRGYATEIATALIAYACGQAGFSYIVSGVDEPNVASSRVLEKVGFRPDGERPGHFGRTLMYRYP